MKIVFILSRFPYPLEKGDKLRAYQHLKNLHASGHEVYLIALSDQKVSENSLDKIMPFCKSVHILQLTFFDIIKNILASPFRKLPLQVGYFYSRTNQVKTDDLIKSIKPDLIYCQLIRTAYYVKNYNSIPRMIDYQDAFSKGTRQRMELSPFWIRPLLKYELNLVESFEKASYKWFDSHVIISEQDRKSIALNENEMLILPNGIDTSFFFPKEAEKRVDVAFVGNMNYPPNIDAACFLVKEVMPKVRASLPGVTVELAGANPSKRVRALASDLVFVTGWVEDIRRSYHSAKVFVAPMRMGIGLQNKLLEAMAMGIPCVTTPLSFEPLGANNNQDILVGYEAGEIATCILKLLNDEPLRTKIGNSGLQFVKVNYSMEHSRMLLESALKQALTKFSEK